MRKERVSLFDHDVFKMVDQPKDPNIQLLPSRFLFRRKFHKDGNLSSLRSTRVHHILSRFTMPQKTSKGRVKSEDLATYALRRAPRRYSSNSSLISKTLALSLALLIRLRTASAINRCFYSYTLAIFCYPAKTSFGRLSSNSSRGLRRLTSETASFYSESSLSATWTQVL